MLMVVILFKAFLMLMRLPLASYPNVVVWFRESVTVKAGENW